MSDPREQLKAMLQDLINDRPEQAEATIHNYIVAKTQQLAGMTPASAAIDESVKAKKTPRPTFKFTTCSYEQFERLCPDSESYDETEINGKSVMVAYDGKNCIGMWYQRAKVGSFCKEFVGDELSYSEKDPNWPYGG